MRVRLRCMSSAHQLDLGVGRDASGSECAVLDVADARATSRCPSTVATSLSVAVRLGRAAACTRKASSASSPFLASLNGARRRLGAPAGGQLGRDARRPAPARLALHAHAAAACAVVASGNMSSGARGLTLTGGSTSSARRRSPATGSIHLYDDRPRQRERRAGRRRRRARRRRRRRRRAARSAPHRAPSSGPSPAASASQ